MKTAAWTMLAAFAIAVCCAAEELLPKVAGQGFPALLCATLWFALMRADAAGKEGVRPVRVPEMLFAVAAGSAEDAVSLLPPATCATFFPAAAAVCAMLRGTMRGEEEEAGPLRRFAAYALACAAAWACCHLWIWAWLGGETCGNVFLRALAAWPVAAASAAAVHCAFSFAAEKAGLGR